MFKQFNSYGVKIIWQADLPGAEYKLAVVRWMGKIAFANILPEDNLPRIIKGEAATEHAIRMSEPEKHPFFNPLDYKVLKEAARVYQENNY